MSIASRFAAPYYVNFPAIKGGLAYLPDRIMGSQAELWSVLQYDDVNRKVSPKKNGY
jgi:hypothetical protein